MRKFIAILALGIALLAADARSASAGWWGCGPVVYAGGPYYVRSYYAGPYVYGYPVASYYGAYTAPVVTNYTYPYSAYYASPVVTSYYPNTATYYSGYGPVYTSSYYGAYPAGRYISTGYPVLFVR